MDASVIRGILRVRTLRTRENVTNSENSLITLASIHAATISLDSSLQRAERN
jgi:hypothetical protein